MEIITSQLQLQITPSRVIRSSKYCVTLWHSLLLREQTSKEGIVTMTNIIYIPDRTWTDLDQEPIFQNFMKEYIDLLQNNLKKIKIKSDSNNTGHYTFICGQAHDPQNPYWQPFKLLSEICKKYKYDPLIARDIIEEKIYKRIECECQILGDQSPNHRIELL
jgi:hypothetical protein